MSHLITKCAQCSRYKEQRMQFIARPPNESPSEGLCMATQHKTTSNAMPDWCPLPEAKTRTAREKGAR